MEYKVKGTAVVPIRDLINELAGTSDEQPFEAIAKEIGLLKHSTILASSWYSAEMTFEAVRLASVKTKMSEYEIIRESVRRGLQADLNGVYRFFMKLGGVKSVFKKLPQMGKTYSNFFDNEVLKNEDEYLQISSNTPLQLSEWTNHILEGTLSAIIEACNKSLNSFKVVDSRENEKFGVKYLKCIIDVKYS